MKVLVLHLFACFVVAHAQTIPELAKKLGANTLVKLVTDAGLADTLSGQGPFTVFGPTDAAFAALPKALVDKLMKDKDLLKSVLLFHVLGGKVFSSQLMNDQTAPTLDNNIKLRINIYGQTVAVDGSKVILADQNATNGVIHVIDKVLTQIPTQNIVQFAASNKDFSSLVYAVIRASLTTTLAGGPFTLFAPTNAAFNKLPPDALNKLLQNETALVEVLTYHVVKGTVYSVGLSNGMVPTVAGKSIKVDISSGGVMVNNAKVTMADIPVTNGVIHVIDTVLLPPK